MIFIKNKYTNWYFSIISNALVQSRSKKTAYYERHHIIPRCISGTNDPENLVLLTAREHFICHRLLVLMVNDGESRRKMILSVRYMTKRSKNHAALKITSRSYDYVKKLFIESMTGNKHYLYGKKISQTTSHKLSLSRIGNTHTKGKLWYYDPLTLKCHMYNPNSVPSGFVEGRKPKSLKKPRVKRLEVRLSKPLKKVKVSKPSIQKPSRILTWEITTPNSTVFTVTNLFQFCQTHGLSQGNMSNVANGKFSQTKGYRCKRIF
jgi:hypothetical protein